jgi:signal peptidase II
MWSPKARVFWPLLGAHIALDVVTKRLADSSLEPGVPHEVFGEFVRFTLSYNRGAAMGLSLGAWSRPAFTLIALVILWVLAGLYRSTEPGQRLRAAAIALVIGGAIGNLIDRFRWSRGVVDFIDIGIGDVRFWTFNVADSGITVGAIALIFLLRDGKDDAAAASP